MKKTDKPTLAQVENDEINRIMEEFAKFAKEGRFPEDGTALREKFEELVRGSKRENKQPSSGELIELTQKSAGKVADIKKNATLHKFVLDNRETLLQLLQPEKQRKSRKFRQSGHFVDQKLKFSMPNDPAPSLFDLISTETKDKIVRNNVEIRTEGIRLTAPQDKLMTALMRLLHDKSEHHNEKSENFYRGNLETQVVPYGGKGQKSPSAMIRIYPSELYKAYLDSGDYSGADIKFIKTLLQDTEQQKFLIIYEKKYEVSSAKGQKEYRTDRIEDFQSLFKIVRFFEGLTEEERRELDKNNEVVREKRGELVIAFNPLLTDQINAKYVEYPEDINRRTLIATGGHKLVTESVIALRDWMLREISTKRKIAEINDTKIPFLLKLDKYVQQKRKKLIQARVQSAIQAVKNLGLITHHEVVTGAQGQWKHIFHLNLDFE
jgi:hypothetical protein